MIPHHHYRGEYPDGTSRSQARALLGLPQDADIALFFGRILDYKNVPALVAAFRRLSASHGGRQPVLTIAGKPHDRTTEQAVRRAVEGDARIALHLCFVPREEAQIFFRAANLVVLPYKEILNSGRGQFDALIVEHSHAAGIVDRVRAIPWILDEHNVESDYFRERTARHALPAPLKNRSAAALQRWEERAWKRATEVTCVSVADAARVACVRGSSPSLIPNGVDLHGLFFRPPSAREGYDILFVGVLGHRPTAMAAEFLAMEVLPRVRRIEPRARLILCGADPLREVRALQSPGVTVTGRVPSVAPYLARAAVYANAVRHGAGTSLKVLEALASGVPLVSTAIGVRGFPLNPPSTTTPPRALKSLPTESSPDFGAAPSRTARPCSAESSQRAMTSKQSPGVSRPWSTRS